MDNITLRVLVCGSRHFDYRDVGLLNETLDKINSEQPISTIIHGKARGADLFSGEWATLRGIPVVEFPADWTQFGKAAGPIRNRQMLSEGSPDLVVAFLAPNGRGTKDMISVAEKAGIPVKIINYVG